MAEESGPSVQGEWFRLKACPGCEYSLETLPVEGVCPECGRGYDQRFIVLTGQGRGRMDSAAGGTWRGVVGQSVWIVLIIWILVSGPRGLKSPHMMAWGVIAVIALATQLYARLFSAREPRMQLWLSPDGVAQVASTPEARRAQWVAVNVSWLFLPIGLVAILFESGLQPGVVSLSVVAVLILGSVIVWGCWRMKRGGAEAVAYTPSLWRWTAIEKVRVQTLSRDRARIRCCAMRTWGRIAVNKEWVIDIEVACPANVAESLHRQMVEWCPKAEVMMT